MKHHWFHAQCLRDTHGASVEGALLQWELSRASRRQVGIGASPLSVAPSTLQPAKANPTEELSEIVQPSSSSGLRRRLIPSWNSKAPRGHGTPYQGWTHPTSPHKAPGHCWHCLLTVHSCRQVLPAECRWASGFLSVTFALGKKEFQSSFRTSLHIATAK